MTQDRLKELLGYDPETGVFTWRVSRGSIRADSVTGALNREGYLLIRVDRRLYLAHRLAFLWMTGAWPEHAVDHINGVRNDNRWENLRNATTQENNHNIGAPPAHNTSGFIGVTWHKRAQKWQARIKLNGKNRFIGYFPTAEVAHAAYLKAKHELHPTHQRLRNHKEQ